MTFKFIVDCAILIAISVLFTRWVFGIPKIIKQLEQQTEIMLSSAEAIVKQLQRQTKLLSELAGKDKPNQEGKSL